MPGPYHQRLDTVRYGNTAIAYRGHSGLETALARLRTSLLTDLSGIENYGASLEDGKCYNTMSQVSDSSIRLKTSGERLGLREVS